VKLVELKSDTFPIQNVLKEGDDISPALCNFGFIRVNRKVLESWEGMELDGTDHLLVFYFFGENSYHRKI